MNRFNNKNLRMITIFLIVFTISLIIIPIYTLAQDPDAAYGAARATSLRRVTQN